MKTTTRHKMTMAGVLALISLALVAIKNEPGQKQSPTILEPGVAPICDLTGAPAGTNDPAGQPVRMAPFIAKDTDTDSPGTNIVTRIVTFTAELGGISPIARQWKVDKGDGFVPIAGATNAALRIGCAQVSDSGLYALFATNSAGKTNTTPVPLIVIEGED